MQYENVCNIIWDNSVSSQISNSDGVHAQYLLWIIKSSHQSRVWTVNLIACKRFAVQTLTISPEFVILNKSQAWQHRGLKTICYAILQELGSLLWEWIELYEKEMKLLKQFLLKTELYEACDLSHVYFHLGVFQGLCVRSHASNGQTCFFFFFPF